MHHHQGAQFLILDPTCSSQTFLSSSAIMLPLHQQRMEPFWERPSHLPYTQCLHRSIEGNLQLLSTHLILAVLSLYTLHLIVVFNLLDLCVTKPQCVIVISRSSTLPGRRRQRTWRVLAGQNWPTGSGVTRGGRGGRVTHPWKVWGVILEGRGQEERREGKGKKRRKGKREVKKKGKWRRKEEKLLQWRRKT